GHQCLEPDVDGVPGRDRKPRTLAFRRPRTVPGLGASSSGDVPGTESESAAPARLSRKLSPRPGRPASARGRARNARGPGDLARFYYLKNKLVKLNQSLIQFYLDFLSDKNYTLVQTPYLINRSSMEGAIIAQDFEDVIYKVEGEDLYLIGTSEHAVASMHSDEIIDGKNLPLRYAGISRCFRKEGGAHGRDQKGIFRVHQFDKVEQFVFSRPEESWNEHERMLSLVEEFYQKIELP